MSSNTETKTLSSLSHHQKSNGMFGDVYAILKDIDILPNAFRFQLPHQAQVGTLLSFSSISFLILNN